MQTCLKGATVGLIVAAIVLLIYSGITGASAYSVEAILPSALLLGAGAIFGALALFGWESLQERKYRQYLSRRSEGGHELPIGLRINITP
jgi:hypothetical protein